MVFVDKGELLDTKNPALKRIVEFGQTVKLPDKKTFERHLDKIVDKVHAHFQKGGSKRAA